MNTKNFFLTLSGLAVILAIPLGSYAQNTTTTPAKPPVHRPAASSTAVKLPANIPPAAGIPKTEYALRYIDTKVGTGKLAAPGLVYSVHYTGWLYDGTKFDSSVDRGTPIQFIQGQRRVIVGWDTGFEGMHVGGKRRLFIPYQLAYGEQGKGPIPAKSNLIFDVELVDMTDPNAPPPSPPTQ
jgi:peptidylprolyl isomerase